MDEVAAAPVNERAVAMPSSTQMYLEAGLAFLDLRVEAGIVVHRNTSVYININQVIPRLGMNIEVYEAPFGRDAPELASHGPNSFP
jgi:hypothetical protein